MADLPLDIFDFLIQKLDYLSKKDKTVYSRIDSLNFLPPDIFHNVLLEFIKDKSITTNNIINFIISNIHYVNFVAQNKIKINNLDINNYITYNLDYLPLEICLIILDIIDRSVHATASDIINFIMSKKFLLDYVTTHKIKFVKYYDCSPNHVLYNNFKYDTISPQIPKQSIRKFFCNFAITNLHEYSKCENLYIYPYKLQSDICLPQSIKYLVFDMSDVFNIRMRQPGKLRLDKNIFLPISKQCYKYLNKTKIGKCITLQSIYNVMNRHKITILLYYIYNQ